MRTGGDSSLSRDLRGLGGEGRQVGGRGPGAITLMPRYDRTYPSQGLAGEQLVALLTSCMSTGMARFPRDPSQKEQKALFILLLIPSVEYSLF